MRYSIVVFFCIAFSCKTVGSASNEKKSPTKVAQQKESGLLATLLIPTMIRKKIQAKKKFRDPSNIKSSNGNVRKELQEEREKIKSDRGKLKDKEKEFTEKKDKEPEKKISEKAKSYYEKKKDEEEEKKDEGSGEESQSLNGSDTDERVVQEDSDYDGEIDL